MPKAPLRSALLVLLASLTACSASIRRFPLRDPIRRDADLAPVSVACRPDPDKAGQKICAPASYESSFIWDAADNTAFRPVARFFAVDPAGESVNVNSLDEVPDSAWFTNRIGAAPMTPEDLQRGPCGDKVLDPTAADGAWVIDQGKPNGANPGFRVKVEGLGKFMLKTDIAEQPERATGATAIAARLYHAAGWWAPCDSVVYLRPSILKLTAGLKVTDNSGVSRPFDQAALDKVLAAASKRGDLVRMVASRWLEGRTLGPFRYESTRRDDPNDVVPHEDRRDLRGARVIAAWLNHFDSREQNTMDTWLAVDPKAAASSPGLVRHYYIDLGDCFGSEWDWDDISRRLGFSYYLDVPQVGTDLLTLGILERPWDRAKRSADGNIFGYFNARDFEPAAWKGGYPNPAFARMSELDGAWAARAIARFTPELVETAVKAGDYTLPRHSTYLLEQLLLRQKAVLRRYFARLSPIADVRVNGEDLCGLDLARSTRTFPDTAFAYQATAYAGVALAAHDRPRVRPSPDGGVCLSLAHVADDGGAADDAPSRYVVVDVSNGVTPGPLRAHLYDLGPARGFRLAGLERPDDTTAPN